jgi:hypothetical protein
MNDIYSLVAKLDQIAERQDPQQKSVHQLPALFKPKNISPVLGSKKDPANPFKGYFVGGESQEHATEDVVSSVKKKLGDYLQDVATAIKKDPTLIDKVSQADHIGPAVKTITTDDGHEIKIHGNEDDGFGVTTCGLGGCQVTVPACEMGMTSICIPLEPSPVDSRPKDGIDHLLEQMNLGPADPNPGYRPGEDDIEGWFRGAPGWVRRS